MYDTETILELLINKISSLEEVQSIGISGSKTPLPKAGEGDIDLFVYCDSIPKEEKRQELMDQLGDLLQDGRVNVIKGGYWGFGDLVYINRVETWLMYFTKSETIHFTESVLDGNHLVKLDNYFYPVGRCAMLKNIQILYDKSQFLHSLKAKLSVYPDKLAEKMIEYHLDKLEDREDLERAVSRMDILFYHFSLDLAIDHYLQVLFAINKVYFPSRKRSLEHISNLTIKPANCGDRLLEVIRLGSNADGINQSYDIWNGMVIELTLLHRKYLTLTGEIQT